MKAVILAAGYGNRLRPLTENTHKTLLVVNGKTIIEGIIDSLLDHGIGDITIVTGYLDSMVAGFVSTKYKGVNFTFIHNPRYAETNNIYSLSLAMNGIELDDDVLLIESDLIYEPSLIRRIIESKYANVALVDRFRSGMDGTVVPVSNHVITNIIPPHLQDSAFDFTYKYKTLNIYKFSKEFCRTTFKQLLADYAKVIDDNCYYELVLGILIYMQRETIFAEIVEAGQWAEVDDPNDLVVAEFIFNKENRPGILEESFGGYWNYNLTDFCFIRNMYFPHGSMLSEMRNNLPGLVANYGSRQKVLNQKLAFFLLCRKENLNMLNGASQIYPMLAARFGGTRVLLPQPTFGEYPRIFRHCEYYSDQVGIDLDQVEEKARGCETVVFVNPNNPTGSLIDTAWIFDYAARVPGKTIIVDESFIDFSRVGSIIDLLEGRPLENVIVIKSLSKSLGIPGIRIGFTYSCDRGFNEAVHDSLPIWNSNSFAEYFLEIVLKHRRSLELSYKATIRDREALAARLGGLDFVERVYPSGGNFLLVEFSKGRTELSSLTKLLLARYAIHVKDVSAKFTTGRYYLRIAVRLPHENEMLAAGMEEIFHRHYGPKWKAVWSGRHLGEIETSGRNGAILRRLIEADGFDRGNGRIGVEAWKQYIRSVRERISLKDTDSLFEVGCGSGAFLYPFYLADHRVGGIDYSGPLIAAARTVMTNMDFRNCDAIHLDCRESYDYVVANSVFFYFPDYGYALEVLRKMLKKSNKGVLALDIPDLKRREECESARRQALPPGEYEKIYHGLSHLYFDKEWFHEFGMRNNCKVDIFDQNIAEYGNARFRFNCVISKSGPGGPDDA